MKASSLGRLCAIGLGVWMSALGTAVAQEAREYLGLDGCTVRDAAISNDGALVLAACRGPNGLYLSRDLGETWQFADGGVYSNGQGDGVAITEHGAYALVATPSESNSTAATLLTSPLPPEGGSFSWSVVTALQGGTSSLTQMNTYIGILAAGRYVAVPMFRSTQEAPSTPIVKILDSTTNNVVASSEIPETSKRIISMEIHDGRIFVVLTGLVNDSLGRQLYRAPFNATTGAIGTWQEITSNLVAAGSGKVPDSVHRGPDRVLFARVAAFGAQFQIWRSSDGGDTFTLAFPSAANSAYYAPRSSTEVMKGCTQGSSVIINNKVSNDGGVTWKDLFNSASATFNLFDNDLCLFDPADTTNNRALVKFADGFRRVTALESSSPSLTKATKGMSGIIVYGMSQSRQQSGTIGLITNAGLAFSRNFTSSERTWLFPVCNGNKSCWANDDQRSAIGVDQNDPMIVYSGTEDVEKGVITEHQDGTFSIAWSTLMENPGNNGWDELRVASTRHLPGVVIAMYRRAYDDPATPQFDEKLGGLYFINNQNGSVIRSGLINQPVYDFIALSDSLMFATVNGASDAAVDGIFRSTDGGASWIKQSDGDASNSAGANKLAYDEARDVLYAGIFTWSSGASVIRLPQASTGTTSWTRAPAMDRSASGSGIRDLLVDEVTGELFASTGRTIYRSADQGESWEAYFRGFTSEVFHAIRIAPQEVPTSQRSLESPGIRSRVQLVGASSVGVSKLSSDPLSAPPDDRSSLLCDLSVERACRRRFSGSRVCRFKVSAIDGSSKQRLVGLSVALEHRSGSRGPWRVAKRAPLRSAQGATVPFLVRRSAHFRATLSDPTKSCSSGVVSIRMRS